MSKRVESSYDCGFHMLYLQIRNTDFNILNPSLPVKNVFHGTLIVTNQNLYIVGFAEDELLLGSF